MFKRRKNGLTASGENRCTIAAKAVLVTVALATGATVVTPPTPASAAARDRLNAGQALRAGQTLSSNNGGYRFVFQADGNAVVYSSGNRAIWSTRTNNSRADKRGASVIMQDDGNLVVYSKTRRPLWSSGTQGEGRSTLIMQDDGNLVVYAPGNRATWSSRAGRLRGPAGGGSTDRPTTTPNRTFPVDEAGTKCASSQTAAIKSIQDYLLRAYPGSVNNGTFVCRKIAGSNTVSLHAVGRAADIKAKSPEQRLAIMRCLVANYKVLGVQRVIDEGVYPRQIWNPRRGTWSASKKFSVPNNVHYEVNLGSSGNGTVPSSRPGFNSAACR